MDTNELAKTMPWVVGLGFCTVKLVQFAIIPGSSMRPDSATGRTEAVMFAPAVTTDWNYITEPQLLVLGAVTLLSVLLALFFVGLLAWNRVQVFRQVDAEPELEPPYSEPAHSVPAAPPKRKLRAFGHR
jgi:hypothetical protein